MGCQRVVQISTYIHYIHTLLTYIVEYPLPVAPLIDYHRAQKSLLPFWSGKGFFACINRHIFSNYSTKVRYFNMRSWYYFICSHLIPWGQYMCCSAPSLANTLSVINWNSQNTGLRFHLLCLSQWSTSTTLASLSVSYKILMQCIFITIINMLFIMSLIMTNLN